MAVSIMTAIAPTNSTLPGDALVTSAHPVMANNMIDMELQNTLKRAGLAFTCFPLHQTPPFATHRNIQQTKEYQIIVRHTVKQVSIK